MAGGPQNPGAHTIIIVYPRGTVFRGTVIQGFGSGGSGANDDGQKRIVPSKIAFRIHLNAAALSYGAPGTSDDWDNVSEFGNLLGVELLGR